MSGSYKQSNMAQMNPIPLDMNIQQQWRNHNIVTDEMVAYFKESIGCQSYHGVMDILPERFVFQFKKQIPEGKVCWLKIDRRNGALNVYQDNLVFTDVNGRNPMVVQNLGDDSEEMVLMPLNQ